MNRTCLDLATAVVFPTGIGLVIGLGFAQERTSRVVKELEEIFLTFTFCNSQTSNDATLATVLTRHCVRLALLSRSLGEGGRHCVVFVCCADEFKRHKHK